MNLLNTSVKTILSFLILSVVSCGETKTDNSGGGTQTPNPNTADGTATTNNNPGTPGTGGTPTQGGISPGGTASSLDIVVIVGIGAESSANSAKYSAALDSLLRSLGTKYKGTDTKIGVIASQAGAVSGVAVAIKSEYGFATGSATQVKFELAPKDAFLATLVAGCAKDASTLTDDHSPGVITVCGEKVNVPPHSWTWTVDDLRGRLSGFLRPGTKREYIFVSSNDAQIIDAATFARIASKQNNNTAAKVFAIAPTASGGDCSNQNLPATILSSAAQSSSGQIYSFCSPSWTSSISSLVGQL